MEKIAEIEGAVKRVAFLQALLAQALFSKFPNSLDGPHIFMFPRTGKVTVHNAVWSFKKHGAGFEFKNGETHEIVDIHKYITNYEIFDPWRVALYLESVGIDHHYRHVERELMRLSEEGMLELVEGLHDYFRIK